MIQIKLLLILFSFQFIIFSNPPLDQNFKELCYGMAQWPTPYCFASPIYGLLCDQSSELKNQLLFGDNEIAKKLLGLLFHLTIGNEFRITAHEPYSKFTTKTLTELIKWVLHLIQKNATDTLDDLIKKIRPTFIGNKNPKRLKELFSAIKECLLQENAQSIRPYITLHALITFMFLQTTSHQKLIEYMRDLQKEFYSDIVTDNLTNITNLKFIETIFNRVHSNFDSKKFLGPIKYVRTLSYKNNPPIADCTEAVLLDLTRIIYSNASNEQKNKKNSIKDFFSKYKLDDVAQDMKARQEWSALCSERQGISYRKKGYEVNPNLQNVIQLLQILFELPANPWEKWISEKDEYWKAEFKKMCANFSHETFSMNCVRLQTKSNTHADIQIQFQKYLENKPIILMTYLHIRQDHMWISRKIKEDYTKELDTILSQNKSDNLGYQEYIFAEEIFDQLHAIRSLKATEKGRVSGLNLKKQLMQRLSTNNLKQLLYIFPTDSDENMYHLTKHAIKLYHEYQDNYYSSCACKIINAINDTHFLYKSLLTTVNYGYHIPFKSTILNKLPSLEVDEQEDINHSLAYHKAYKDVDYKFLLDS